MKIQVLFLFALLPLFLIAQQTTYYENLDFHEEVSKKKANYKKVVFLDKDTTITQTIQLKGAVLRKEIKKRNGQPIGVWKTYDREGILTSEQNFNTLVYSNQTTRLPWMTSNSKENLENFEEARFPNGEEALAAFVKRELRAPKELLVAREARIRLFIDQYGTAIPHSIPRRSDMLLDMAAWQLIKKMPQWIPATKNDIPVASFLVVPIRFESSF